MNNKLDVIARNDLLEDVERIYSEHYMHAHNQVVHDIFNAVKRCIRRSTSINVVPIHKYDDLRANYKKLLETADILDNALREYQNRYGEFDDESESRWEYYSTSMMECSNCKRHTAIHRFRYCPHCGSKMNLETSYEK